MLLSVGWLYAIEVVQAGALLFALRMTSSNLLEVISQSLNALHSWVLGNALSNISNSCVCNAACFRYLSVLSLALVESAKDEIKDWFVFHDHNHNPNLDFFQ